MSLREGRSHDATLPRMVVCRGGNKTITNDKTGKLLQQE